nr:CNP1-like family protein [uncultured Rhodoferax sp.]
MAFKSILWGLGLALVSACAAAQTPIEAPEWTEESAPPPPAYSLDKLIPIEMPHYVTLQVGIDPASVSVGASDRVVRYVVVMRNASGSSSAAYEGIQCTKGEVKTYARAGSTGQWVAIKQPEWRALTDNLPSRHAFAIAKQGGCDGRTSAKREDTIQALARGRKAYD